MADVGATTCPPVVGMIRGEGRADVETVGKKTPIAKDCLLTLVKSRLARSFVRHHAGNGPIHRKMVVD